MRSWRRSSIAQRPRTSVVPSAYPVESLPPPERRARARFLIVAGIVADRCVDMAARDASGLRYLGRLPEGACVAYSQQRRDGALSAFGDCRWVSDIPTVLKRLRDIA
jgi:hypothetical protein